MSPELLMQPFEQTYNTGYYQQQQDGDINYVLGYSNLDNHNNSNNGDFRPTFYNPFEIKHRRRTSRAQLKILEKSFMENPKPNATVRRILAQKLDMTPRGVQIWFQNRRAKAKLQRRKSGQEEQQQQQPVEQSPILFSQFFNNLKAWDNSARSIANIAAASCMYDSNTSTPLMESVNNLSEQQQASAKVDEWFKLPIHPLAPVIDSTEEFDFTSSSSPAMSSDEWRRKSCPSLSTRPSHDSTWSTEYNLDNRRMTEDLLFTSNRFAQPYPLMKTTNSSECGTPAWNSTSSSNLDFYPNLNYSPMSQQLTPMLSTGSPVSSVDGGYYDSCLDMLMVPSSSSMI